MATSAQYDVAIVGAGIVGAACAWWLTRAGCRVIVLEADVPGAGTTATGMGHLVALDESPEQFRLAAYSLELWAGLRDRLPAGVEYASPGTLWIAADADDEAAMQAKAGYYRQHGMVAEILNSRELALAEPALRPGLRGAVRVPGDAIVFPPAAAYWFVDQAVARGATLRRDAWVRAVDEKTVELADGTRIHAEYVVVAAGNASQQLVPQAEIQPRKGHLLITARDAPRIRYQLIELGYMKSAHGRDATSVAFNAQPRVTGQILIGSSRQFGDLSPAIVPEVLEAMLLRATSYLPKLRDYPALRAWTGLRPCTPDNLPYIGPVRPGSSILLACGHEGLGITTATGTAALITSLVSGVPPALDVKPYLLGRLKAQPAPTATLTLATDHAV